MVITWTNKRAVSDTFIFNTYGHYDIPYPDINTVGFQDITPSEPEFPEVILSSYTYQGLTLARFSRLDLHTRFGLVWLDTKKTEVYDAKTNEQH